MVSSSNPPAQSLVNLIGYTCVEKIHQGLQTVVYRAIHAATQRAVIVKVLRQEYPSVSDLLKFRNQYTIAQNLVASEIVPSLSLESCGNGYALVMEDLGSISLEQYSQQKSLTLVDVLEIAIKVADILHALYQHRVIHKDIKPGNILIHPESQQVHLIDFSLASLLPKENQLVQNPNTLEGTLFYLAPEQTGRMNRGIDYRADYYAFGVTLYQLLTGQLPFQSDDVLELVHCHMAKIAKPVHQVNAIVPEAVSAIVAKLMAKNAEERYQSALGLKYDLEQCLAHLQRKTAIVNFELGQRDVCDRFLIPEKLYGRDIDVQALLDAFERISQGTSELMLITGLSGIGKTAVVNEIHKPITQQKGYFIKGKFDQFNRNIPFSAFVQAFRSLMGQLLGESDEALVDWKAKILDAVGENGQILIEVIPELEHIIDKQPPVPELSGNAAQNLFNLIFGKFIRVFTTPNHPLVIFLDDLQWIDSASLNLFRLLMDDDSSYLLVLGAYRNNEVFAEHPLMLTLANIRKQVTVNTLTLSPLKENDISYLVADSLHCSIEIALPLTQLVYQKTKGNPFFTTQFLKGLAEDGWITFNVDAGYWQCDLTQVCQLALTDDVVTFMVKQIQKLPEATQTILKIAACMGNRFDLATLAVVCEQNQEDISAKLWRALQASLVIPENQTYKFFQGYKHNIRESYDITVKYRFLHDRVQQAAYSLIPASEKEKTHYQIGKLLSQSISQQQVKSSIFKIVGQLNLGQTLLQEQSERDNLAQLNLIACHRAKNATAYQAGFDYAKTGLSLLGESLWQRQYELSLELHNLATELAYLTSDFSSMESLASTIQDNAKRPIDKSLSVHTQIQFHASQQQLKSAITIARAFLKELGLCLPIQLSFEEIQQEYRAFQGHISKFNYRQILELPLLKEPEQLAIARTLMSISSPAIASDTNLFWFIILKIVKLSLKNGNSPYSAYAYVSYGILSNFLEQDIEKYYQFGQLSLNVVDLFEKNVTRCRTLSVVGAYTAYLKDHFRGAVPFLDKAYASGLESGDFEYAGNSLFAKHQILFFSGELLSSLKSELIKGKDAMERLNNRFVLGLQQILIQTALKLSGQLENPYSLDSRDFRLDEQLRSLKTTNNKLSLQHFCLYEMLLGFLFSNWNQIFACIQIIENCSTSVTGWITDYIFRFYESLFYLDYIHGQKDLNPEQVTQYLNKVQINQDKFLNLAVNAPMNFQHKYDLVEAERHKILDNKFEALEHYDTAIAGAREHNYIQEEALANELAAKFYLDWGKEKVAAGYMQEAYYCYTRWGAKAKAEDLENRYPDLLHPIIQTAQFSNPFETLASVNAPNISIHSSSSSISSGVSSNNYIDLAAVLRAAQLLAESIDIDDLLTQLVQLVLQNSGADKLVIVLPDHDESWQVRAIATPEKTQLSTDPLIESATLPMQLMRYVKNTREIIAIDDLETDLPIVDAYLQRHRPRSVLCLPILHRGNPSGLLYLQNQSIAGVFHRDRILILNFLCTQAAISLTNAHLYQQSQINAQSLAQSLSQLQASAARFRNMAANIPGVIYQLHMAADGNTSVLYASPDCKALYGISAEAIMANQYTFRDFVHSEDRLAIDQKMAESVEFLQPFDQDFRIVMRSGKVKWVNAISRPSPQPDGTIIWDGVVIDISERKYLEQEQSRLTAVLEATPDFIGVANAQGEILWHNKPLRQLRKGLANPEDHRLIASCHPDWVNQIIRDEALPTAIQHGSWSGELAILDGEGHEIPVSQVIIAHKSAAGEVETFSTIMRDIRDIKRAEAALKLSEARAKAAFEQATVGIAESNLTDGKITRTNNSFCQMTGYTAQELEALTADDLTHPEDLSASHYQVKKLYTGEIDSFTVEKRYRRKDSSYFWASTAVTLIQNPEEESYRCLAVIQDISDRKATELALKNSQARFLRMTENVPGMIYRYILRTDNRDELTYVSSQVRELFEIEPEPALQDVSCLWERVHPYDVAKLKDALQVSAETLQPLRSEHRLNLPKKGIRWVQLFAQPERLNNGDTAWDGVLVDISDRKQAEAKQKQQLAILESASDFIGSADPTGTILYLNQAWRQLLQKDDGESANRILISEQHPAWALEIIVDEALPEAAQHGIWSGETALLDGDQREIPVSQVIIAHKSSKGEVEYFSTIARDISDLKQAERLLTDYNDELERQVQERTRELQENEERLQLALSATRQGFFDLNLQTGDTVVSPEYALMLGYDPAIFQETDVTWRSRLHPDDRKRTNQAYKAYERGQTDQYKVEFRLQTQGGDWKWILSIGQFIEWDEAGRPTRLLGTHTDISDRKFAEIQLAAQNMLLAKIAEGQPLLKVLNALIYSVEHNLEGVSCSVLFIDKENRLRHGAAPSLPNDYNQAVHGILIGEGVGSCGTAAFRNQTVIVTDIATDPLWCPCKDLALSHGLRACWSSPITARGGEVLGTFAMYYKQIKSPQPHELRVITQMAHIAGIAIERERAEARLRQSEATLLKAQQVAHVGNWEFDLASQTMAWSPEMFRIYGLEPASSSIPYSEYLQMLPDDTRAQWQQYVEHAITEGTPYTLEYSLTQTDGSVGHHKCRAEVEHDAQGQVIRLFGTTLDITDLKQTELALQNLVAGTAATTGQDFFPALVSHISTALDVPVALVTQFVDQELHSLAFVVDGELQPNFTYDLTETPCVELVVNSSYYCPDDLVKRFPNHPHRARGVKSYLGVALRDRQGQVLGSLCIFDRQPLRGLERARQILNVFGSRAAAELERQRTENALENLIEGTAALTGPDFFTALVRHIATALNASHAFVTEVVEGDQLHFLAAWGDGQYLSNDIVDIEGTTCAIALRQGSYQCSRDVVACFPQNPNLAAMEVESYMGVALQNCQGESLGTLCIFSRQPLADPERSEQILRVFAARAAAELERQRAEILIKQQFAAIEAAIDGISILKNGVYLYVNQAHLHLFGYEHADELVGKSWKRLYSASEVRRFEQEILPNLAHGQGWEGEAIATRKDGSTFAQGVSLTLTEDGLLISVCRDISELKQAQALITHNALHDPLTGLPNRALLLERLTLAMQCAHRKKNYRYALLFLDLDRFKVINDSLGHVVGDQLLVTIAHRLKTHLRQTDLVARLGGDEFLVLLEDISSTQEVAQIAERILADGQTPIILNEHQVFTSMSIGIVLSKEDYQNATDLIRDADIAMYQAKTDGRNLYRFFDTAMHAEAIKRLTLETDLRKAVDQQEFTIYYQPIIELSNRQLVGFEALVRWHHATRGLIKPDDFIPIAEETGCVQFIDSWMLHHACQQVVTWQKQFPQFSCLKISINLSAHDLSQTNLIQEIDEILASTGLVGNCITLEITESLLIKDIDPIIDLLMQLTSRQIQISIDDFGTGYSSLNYLHRLPVHSLKIDRSFVGQMELKNRNYKVVSTIIGLGQQLGLNTIAEGIETPQQLKLLQNLGCQFGQGYLVSKPLSAQEIETHFLQGTDFAALC